MSIKFIKVVCICLLVGFCLSASLAHAQTNFNVFIGQKVLSKSAMIANNGWHQFCFAPKIE